MSPRRGIKPKSIKPAHLSPQEQAIKAAYGDGKLFVHMFEMPLMKAIKQSDTPRESLQSFFDVMAGKEKSFYKNKYYNHQIKGCADGHPALPTTLISKGQPVPLFTDVSHVGILLDGRDEEHAKPLFVNHRDAFSETNVDTLQISLPKVDRDNVDLGDDLRVAQDGSDLKYMHCGLAELTLSKILPERRTKAEAAVRILRNVLKNEDWEQIYPKVSGEYRRGMNEVLLSAHLAAIKGIVVSEIDDPRDYLITWTYTKAVHEADKLCQWLSAHYPEQFPKGSLPIVSYNPDRRRDQMRVLTEEQIQHPELPGAVAFRR